MEKNKLWPNIEKVTLADWLRSSDADQEKNQGIKIREKALAYSPAFVQISIWQALTQKPTY